jgi:hypothetical protein
MNATTKDSVSETAVRRDEPNWKMVGWLVRTGAFLATWLLSGCVGLLPVPSGSKVPEAGQVITRQETSFMVAGKTTRSEVMQRFGPRARECPRAPVLAYSWELPGGSTLWWWFVVTPEAAGGRAGELEWNHWRALFVGFDQQDKVAVTELVRLSNGKSLDEQLERWAARHKLGARPARSKTEPMLASPSPGVGDSPDITSRENAALAQK